VQAALAADLGPALAVFPVAPHVAPEIAPLERDDDLFMAVNARTLRATLATSFLDMPGVSLPMGLDADALPSGLLVTGATGADDRVLAVAFAVEVALGARQE
jgi:aspartyl-tRNA(Asn)/glutamyl-tRNA(Gln) amidotransferase subunit A